MHRWNPRNRWHPPHPLQNARNAWNPDGSARSAPSLGGILSVSRLSASLESLASSRDSLESRTESTGPTPECPTSPGQRAAASLAQASLESLASSRDFPESPPTPRVTSSAMMSSIPRIATIDPPPGERPRISTGIPGIPGIPSLLRIISFPQTDDSRMSNENPSTFFSVAGGGGRGLECHLEHLAENPQHLCDPPGEGSAILR